MQRTRAVGLALSGAGIAGYAVGAVTPYPGRALSLPAVMVGLALAAVGGAGGAP
jgi:hypothetical protein